MLFHIYRQFPTLTTNKTAAGGVSATPATVILGATASKSLRVLPQGSRISRNLHSTAASASEEFALSESARSLSINIAIVFVVQQLINNLADVLLPHQATHVSAFTAPNHGQKARLVVKYWFDVVIE